MTIFDILNSLSYTKIDLSEEEDFEREYNAFMINRFLSMSEDTVFYANETTKMSSLPNNVQYQFLLNSIPKKKRYFKYAKGEKKSKEINIVKTHFQINESVAMEFLEILTPKQIKSIKDFYKNRI